MMPDWMNFVVGVIDSPDLPLNVSREMLQQTKVLQALKNQLKKQVMNMMNELLYSDDKYSEFYTNFHKNIKLAIHEGEEQMMTFLKIKNSKDERLINFDQYIEEYRKDENQKVIYYLTGSESRQSLFSKLYIENGYNVLFFDEPIDEFMLQKTYKYKEYDLINVAKDHEVPWKAEITTIDDKIKAFCECIKTTLNDSNIDEVKISNKLIKENDEPACVISSKWGWTGNMEKLMMFQPLNDSKSYSFMKGKRILELNLQNKLITNLLESFDETTKTFTSPITEKIELLYQCCLLSGGFPLNDTNQFIKNVMNNIVV